MTTNRIDFADQLRGAAALLVVANHYTGVYWFGRGIVAALTFSPEQSGPIPPLAEAVAGLPINTGPLGVAIFFLISGFVIPFSFRRHGTASFLLARLTRIYPTYLAALAASLFVRYLSSRYWGESFVVGPVVLLSNALLVNDLVGIGSIDLVNWTLAVELKFYLLFAFSRSLFFRWQAWSVVAIAIGVIGLNLAVVAALPHLPLRAANTLASLAIEAMYLPFMFLGALFFLHFRGDISSATLSVASATGLALFLLCWRVGPDAASWQIVAPNYLWGWTVFALGYCLRRHFVAIAPLRLLASISYPLYLVHSIVGFVILKVVLMGFGLPYPLALAIALGSALLLALAIHLLIERRSIAWGRRFSSASGLSFRSLVTNILGR